MTAPALATVNDLGTYLGAQITDTDARAAVILATASAQVRAAAGQTWLDAEGRLTSVHELAWTVTIQAAARAWANPTGAASGTAGPFAATWAAGVALTADEKEQLAALPRPGAANGSVPGLGSVRVVAPAYASGSRWQQEWAGDDPEDGDELPI